MFVAIVALLAALAVYPFVEMYLFPLSDVSRVSYIKNAGHAMKTDGFPDERSECIHRLVKNHQVVPSSGVVLAKRFTRHDSNQIDSALFDMLTIAFSVPLQVRSYSASDQNISLYLSYGAWSWVPHCAGYYAVDFDGAVDVLDISERRVKAAMRLDVRLVSAREDKVDNVRIDGVYSFERTSLEEWNETAQAWDWVLVAPPEKLTE